MLGAIAGDIFGSVHEYAGTKDQNFPLFDEECAFTDDTVLTVAVAECLLDGKPYTPAFHRYYHMYPDAGWGGTFARWAAQRLPMPYQSWGNGSAMRVSPVGWAFHTMDEVLLRARICRGHS